MQWCSVQCRRKNIDNVDLIKHVCMIFNSDGAKRALQHGGADVSGTGVARFHPLDGRAASWTVRHRRGICLGARIICDARWQAGRKSFHAVERKTKSPHKIVPPRHKIYDAQRQKAERGVTRNGPHIPLDIGMRFSWRPKDDQENKPTRR